MLSGVNEGKDADMQLGKMRQNLAKMDPARGPKRFLRELPKKGPFWVKYQDIPEPLHWAASTGDSLAVKEFVCGLDGAKMISPNEPDVAGRTPVMRACAFGMKECVDVLIKEYYQTPRPDPVQLNMADKLGWNALFYAAAGGHMEIIQSLIKKKGFDLNQADIMRRTALHIASLHGKSEVVRYLISKGADPSLPDAAGRASLHCAAAVNHTFLHTALANPPDRKLRVIHLERPPLPTLAFTLPPLPSQKGLNLLDVLRDVAAARRRTDGITPWGPTDPTTRQYATCRALVTKGAADRRARAGGEGGPTPLEMCRTADDRLRALLEPPPADGEAA